MKIRQSFVSNSSSSSFIINLDKLTGKQVKMIENHADSIEDTAMYEPWSIQVTDSHVKGSTMMDNFDMEEYLAEIGVNEEDIEWGY